MNSLKLEESKMSEPWIRDKGNLMADTYDLMVETFNIRLWAK